MDAYEEFQRILAELKHKINQQENTGYTDFPPGFEEIFKTRTNKN